MHFLFLRAYAQLVLFDFLLLRGDFNVLHRKVRQCPTGDKPRASDATERVCAAIDMACIWYRKEVLCLQRSAATACLLKRCGVAAEMVTGVQQIPFKSHAWVEVDGKVVNDKPYMHQMYSVLDRC